MQPDCNVGVAMLVLVWLVCELQSRIVTGSHLGY
jgi:hypothetical protein